MWTKPGYKSPAAPAPPQESGVRLASFERDDGDTEVRVTRDEFKGHPYIGIRLWTRDRRTGAFWPTKTGVTVRMSEVAELAEVLDSIATGRGAKPDPAPVRPDQDDEAPRYVEKVRKARKPADASSLAAAAAGTRPGFDEFAGG